MAVIVFWSRVTDRVWVAEMSVVERSFSSLWIAGSGGLDASVVIGPLSCSLLDSSIVSNVGLHWGILTVSHTEPLVCVRARMCVLTTSGCRESVFQKAHCRLTPTSLGKRVCFSNVRSWWESEAALWRDYDCFSRKMEWRERKKEECKGRWWLLSIISLTHSTDRGNREALPFCWSIPLFWEDSQHNRLSISPSIYCFLCIFFPCFSSVHLSFGFCYVFSDNCFSLTIILEVNSFANEQIVIKSYKFLYYSACEMESRVQFMVCDKSKIRVGVAQVEGWGCVSFWWWCMPTKSQWLIIHALRSQP